MRNTTLLFLVKESGGNIAHICLAMKKRGFGIGRWNGVGGKVEKDESIENAVIREAEEEIGVKILKMHQVAELEFSFVNNPDWNQIVHTYFSTEWSGEPTETEEMKPAWYKVDKIPFKDMWPDDIFWLPHVISNKLVKASFSFGEKDVILNQEVKIVDRLTTNH